MKKMKDHEARLTCIEESNTQIDSTIHKVKALRDKLAEIDDGVEKIGNRATRLMKTSRNTERALRSNGLLLDGDFLSRSSGSELEWRVKEWWWLMVILVGGLEHGFYFPQ